VSARASSSPAVPPGVGAVLSGAVVFLVAVLVILVAVAPDAVRWLGWASAQGVVGSATQGRDATDLVYAFEADGRAHEGEHEIPSDTELKAGSPVSVRYDPADPDQSVPAPAFEEALAFLLGMIVVAAAVSLGAGILVHRLLRR